MDGRSMVPYLGAETAQNMHIAVLLVKSKMEQGSMDKGEAETVATVLRNIATGADNLADAIVERLDQDRIRGLVDELETVEIPPAGNAFPN